MGEPSLSWSPIRLLTLVYELFQRHVGRPPTRAAGIIEQRPRPSEMLMLDAVSYVSMSRGVGGEEMRERAFNTNGNGMVPLRDL